jgi:hypothetical protein
MSEKRTKKYYDCSFGDYTGRSRYAVKHPKYREIITRAPDDIAAIKAAGDFCGEDWLSYQYYPYCTVNKL